MSTTISMSANESTLPDPLRGTEPGRRGIVSSGWLAADTTLGTEDKRKIAPAMLTSLVLHGGLLAVLILAFAVVPQQLIKSDPLEFKVVAYVPEIGRGGGGGGSPAPAPPKPVEIPKHAPPVSIPVAVPIPVDPPPTLVAPIETNSNALLQAPGNSAVSLADRGGLGSGGGIGAGRGNGVGPGTGGGFGDGAYAPGNGVTMPTLLVEVKPKYTPDGMRAKIQGAVELEIVILENGTVGAVRVTKSLDRASGLDDAAVEAAKKWRFTPGMKDGKPVATKVPMVLEFRLH